MIAGRLELLLLLFIVVHGKVVTHPQTVHDVSSCALDVAVATNSTHTTVVHNNSRHGSGHKQ